MRPRAGGRWFAARSLWWIWAATVLAILLAATTTGAAPAASAACVATLVPAALVDVRDRRLPDRLLGLAGLVLAAGWVIGAAPGEGEGVAASASGVAAGAAVLAGPLLALHLLSPASMGFGDVKAAVVLGAAVGAAHWQLALPALALAAGFSATVALLIRARTIPFGPGLVSGAAIVLAAGAMFVPSADAAPTIVEPPSTASGGQVPT